MSAGTNPIIKKPNMAIDIAIFTIIDNQLHVLLIKRENSPFQGHWSLVGGYVDIDRDKTLEDTARRKLLDKTSVTSPYLEQVKTIGSMSRDPRGWTVSVSYFALLPSQSLTLVASNGAADVKWAPINDDAVTENLAFDHEEILAACLKRMRAKTLYSTMPLSLMPNAFSMASLQQAFETILNEKMAHKSFRRRMLASGMIEETGEFERSGRRPAALYRMKSEDDIHYFSRNMEGPR